MNQHTMVTWDGKILLHTEWIIKIFGYNNVHAALFDYDSDYAIAYHRKIAEILIIVKKPYITIEELYDIYNIYSQGNKIFNTPEGESKTLALLNER